MSRRTVKPRAREDQSIIGYLLGTASELEQSHLETRYFREPHFYELLLALEEELICDYLHGKLPPAERLQFERYFLSTPRRRRKYESTRKLLAFIADQGTPQTSLIIAPEPENWLSARLRWLNSFFMPRLSSLGTLASVAVLAVGVWMLSVQVAAYRRQVETQEAQLQVAAKKTLPKPRPKPHLETDKETGKESGGRETDPTQKSLTGFADQLQASLDEPPALLTASANPHTVGLTLKASTLRAVGVSQQLTLPAEATSLSLCLLLGGTTLSNSFNAALKTLEGREILRRQNLSAQVTKSDRSLTLEVPASLLHTGRYVVSLTANQTPYPTSEYFLQINRE